MMLNEDPINVNRFEGLLEKHPLLIERHRKLYFTIEHHAESSLGGYEAELYGETKIFHKLKDAVAYLNKKEKKK